MKKFYALTLFAIFFFSANLFAQLDFTVNPTIGCPGNTYTFTNTSTNPSAYRFEWHFQDGSPTLVDTMAFNETVTHIYANPGNYCVWVDVYDNTGGYINYTYGSSGCVQVNGVSGINSPDTVCPNEMVSFCPNGNTNSVSWDFGDGNQGTNNQGCDNHAYTALGTYTVTLVANTTCGTYTVTKSIVVNNSAIPNVFFWRNPNNNACPNQPINFYTNQWASYQWNFGDGNTSTQQSPSHSYTATGTYTVVLLAVNNCGNQGSDTNFITINSTGGFPGGMGIGGGPNPACPGQQLNAYLYGGGSYVKYLWDFGDSSPKDSSGTNVYHTYTVVGTYTVSCKVTNYCGPDSTFYQTVTIDTNQYIPNNVNLNANNSPACPNTNLNLSASGGFMNYIWNFGDGSPQVNTGNQSNQNHTYVLLGTYTASVTFENACGNDTTLYTVVQITNSAPFQNNINLTINPNPSCPGDIVVLNGPWGYSNYQFNFGDGSPVVSGTYNGWQHVYNTVGSYTASVIVTNNCGNDSTLYAVVNVTNNAGFSNFNLSINNPNPCPNEPVIIYATFGYPKYVWNFGDGSPADSSTGNQGIHTYTAAGTYSLSLTVTNNCGQDSTFSGQITINSNVTIPPNLNINVYSTPACPGASIQFQAPGGSFVSYVWNMGDGFIDSISNSTYLFHSYSAVGTYTVSLIIANYCGDKDTLYTTVVINSTLGFPTNNFNLQIQPNPACPGQGINMWAPYDYQSYVWNYGDGNTDSISYSGVFYFYASVGTYSVSVKIYNYCGKDTTLYGTVTIGNNVGFSGPLNFDVNPSPSCPSDPVSFSTSGGYASYLYTFGDGDTAFGNDWTDHIYAANGNYTVSVTITNQCGIDTTLYSSVTIDSSGIFSNWITISAYPSSSCINDRVNFELQGSFQTYLWDFGDGDTLFSTSKEVQHTYTSNGVFSVSCEVTNGCGKTKTFYTTAQITILILNQYASIKKTRQQFFFYEQRAEEYFGSKDVNEMQ